MAKLPKLLSMDEIQKLLSKLPADVKLDVLQFGLDLMGLVNPAADAANAAISLWRGDFLGAAFSAISIIPFGDVVKLAKLGQYAKTFETLVTKVIPKNAELYRELTPVMTQFRSLLAKIPAGNASVDAIREQISKFFRNAELHRLASGMKNLENLANLAKKRGRWKNPAFAKGGTTPEKVVDQLLDAAEHGGHTTLRRNAKEMIQQMGHRDWVLSAGPHKTTATAGNVKDKTPHITLELAGEQFPYHLRLDAKGNLFEIRTMGRVDGKLRATNPVPGTPRPYQGPGQ